MTTIQGNKPWDFSQVLDLVNALSSPPLTNNNEQKNIDNVKTSVAIVRDHSNNVDKKDFGQSAASLGDFGKIWQFLGTPTQLSEPRASFVNKDDYTSDGAITYGLRTKERKKVTWKEETSAEETAFDSVSDRSPTPTPATPKLTKSQRKKQNRKDRKAKEVRNQGTVSESEADNIWPVSPARKASTHAVLQNKQYDLRPRNATGRVIAVTEVKQVESEQPESQSQSQPPKRIDASLRQSSEPEMSQHLSLSNANDKQGEWPIATPKKVTMPFFPASITPRTTPQHHALPVLSDSASKAVQAVKNAQAELIGGYNVTTPTKTSTNLNAAAFTSNQVVSRASTIEPKIVRSGEDRHWALLLKLINEYNEDRKYLVAPMNMTTHNNDPTGIHIFVDASNIFIGFNDQLKRSRGIPIAARVPPVDLSFDALALLMERRRPVAKRVLVGSTPHQPAFSKAKAVGYECNILEKVYKAKELTERQIYFRDTDRRHGRVKAPQSLPSTSPSNGFLSDDWTGASGSETTAVPQFAPAKMIEQGVDEILHLKILESIVDSEAPATMVIATGDAAQAEYSDGFMAMTLRALKKGWNVELVSWSKNISSMYLRKAFRSHWGDQFKIVFLDDYAEELLDM